MKRKISMMLVFMMSLSLVACGGNSKTSAKKEDNKEIESEENQEIESEKNQEIEYEETVLELGNLKNVALKVVDDDIASLRLEYEKLTNDVDTYDKYLKNRDRIEFFYDKVYDDARNLCIRMREYSAEYAELIMASSMTNDEKYEEFEEIYDYIYDDAGDDIYDEIYDGILDEIYDYYYDGILDEAYDDAPYDEWHDARSDEYDWWADARSDVYDEWSDFRSDIYDFWCDMRSELWDDDIDRAEEKMEDFKEDIEKLKSDNN